MERWNGTAWSIQETPIVTREVLEGVSCSSATACIAVGFSEATVGTKKVLAEKWNGTAWSIQEVPNPTGATSSTLAGVSCPSATACFAAGYYSSASTAKTLVEKWNGTTWSIQETPNQAEATSSKLTGVSCTSTTACTASGNGTLLHSLAERWNGTAWSVQATPAEFALVFGVSCGSATSCTMVGFGASVAPLAQAWNGTEWARQTTPSPSEATEVILHGDSCSSATVCTAVGYYKNSAGARVTLAERYQ